MSTLTKTHQTQKNGDHAGKDTLSHWDFLSLAVILWDRLLTPADIYERLETTTWMQSEAIDILL
ncbi:MAG: hypothetical protein ACO20I_16845, partial [bacterium]